MHGYKKHASVYQKFEISYSWDSGIGFKAEEI